MTEPRARVVADSISPLGHRVTTIEAVIHRFVLAELNTHRVFSRNSASSRAIPFPKQVEKVETSPAVPVLWPAEQKGMQGGDEVENIETAEYFWLKARDRALDNAKNLADLGVHKSVVNRLLEPFMYHTVVITATAWQNFFNLRCNPMAQPEIRIAADFMSEVYDASTPRFIDYGMWHLPYIDTDDIRAAEEYLHTCTEEGVSKKAVTRTLVQMSSARCARTSYETQDGVRSPAADLTLYNRLTGADPMHASPLEHPCTPTDRVHNVEVHALGTDITKMLVLPSYGNLTGWHQHRFDVEVLADYQAFS
jgi:hypothetical protein